MLLLWPYTFPFIIYMLFTELQHIQLCECGYRGITSLSWLPGFQQGLIVLLIELKLPGLWLWYATSYWFFARNRKFIGYYCTLLANHVTSCLRCVIYRSLIIAATKLLSNTNGPGNGLWISPLTVVVMFYVIIHKMLCNNW